MGLPPCSGWSGHGGILTERNMAKITHGMKGTAEYRAWLAIKTRCHNPNFPWYRYYGGRGIRVCDQWKNNFVQFYNDMGLRPSNNHSIERLNNEGHYEPSNCKWATKKEQCNNKRNNRKLKLNKIELTIKEWSDLTGIPWATIGARIDRLGWSVREALTTPSYAKRNR